MSKIELISVETDTKKVYKPSDNFVFTLTLNCQEQIDDDVEFEITYFGDAYSEDHDQKIGYNVVGPLQAGKQFFNLETSAVDLTKIPIKTLFGVTTILITGKYKNQQFIRIGYVVNVGYPGIAAEKFIDADEQPIVEDIDEEEEDDDEEIEEEDDDEELEVMDDDEIDEEVEEDDEENDEEGDGEEGEDDEAAEEDDDEEGDDNKECDGEEDADNPREKLLDGILGCFNQAARKHIPLETPIIAGKDDFEYKGMELKQSKIEMTLHESPIIHVYEIEWDGAAEKVPEEDHASSSENADNSSAKRKKEIEEEAEVNNNKKAKLE